MAQQVDLPCRLHAHTHAFTDGRTAERFVPAGSYCRYVKQNTWQVRKKEKGCEENKLGNVARRNISGVFASF